MNMSKVVVSHLEKHWIPSVSRYLSAKPIRLKTDYYLSSNLKQSLTSSHTLAKNVYYVSLATRNLQNTVTQANLFRVTVLLANRSI